jgi:hypothetical protein
MGDVQELKRKIRQRQRKEGKSRISGEEVAVRKVMRKRREHAENGGREEVEMQKTWK